MVLTNLESRSNLLYCCLLQNVYNFQVSPRHQYNLKSACPRTRNLAKHIGCLLTSDLKWVDHIFDKNTSVDVFGFMCGCVTNIYANLEKAR